MYKFYIKHKLFPRGIYTSRGFYQTRSDAYRAAFKLIVNLHTCKPKIGVISYDNIPRSQGVPSIEGD
jgi:hypothetical protein